MERLKKQIEDFKKEQITASERGYPIKSQQELFLHSPYPHDETDKIARFHIATGLLFRDARGISIDLLDQYDSLTEGNELEYRVSFPDQVLPYYMYHFDERNADPNRERIPEDTAVLRMHLRELKGMRGSSRSVHIEIEKYRAAGYIMLSEDYTRVHLPSPTYRNVPKEKIYDDTSRFVRLLSGLRDIHPDIYCRFLEAKIRDLF